MEETEDELKSSSPVNLDVSSLRLLAPGPWWVDVWLRGVRGTSATGDSNGREGQCVCLSGDPKVVERGKKRWLPAGFYSLQFGCCKKLVSPEQQVLGAHLRQLGREGAGMTEEAAVPDPPTPSVTAHSRASQRL